MLVFLISLFLLISFLLGLALTEELLLSLIFLLIFLVIYIFASNWIKIWWQKQTILVTFRFKLLTD